MNRYRLAKCHDKLGKIHPRRNAVFPYMMHTTTNAAFAAAWCSPQKSTIGNYGKLNTYLNSNTASVPPVVSGALKLIQGLPDRAQDSSPTMLDIDDAFAASSTLETHLAEVELVEFVAVMAVVAVVVVNVTADVAVIVVPFVVVVVVVVAGYRLWTSVVARSWPP